MPTQEEMERIRRRASMDYWYPKLEKVDDINIPKTYRVDIRRFEEAMELTEGVPMPDAEAIEKGVRGVDGPPAFIRSDQASYKHKMSACKIERGDNLQDVNDKVFEVLNHNNMLSFTGLPFTSVYVREWLDIHSTFKAFNETPITAEVRCFINDGEFHDYGFYWPKAAVEQHMRHTPELPDDWRDLHDKVRHDAMAQYPWGNVETQAERVAEEFDGYWSVDFALVADHDKYSDPDDWYCIDMAPGKASWHPDGVEKPEGI